MLHTQVLSDELCVEGTYTSHETEVNGCWSMKSTHLIVKDADPTYENIKHKILSCSWKIQVVYMYTKDKTRMTKHLWRLYIPKLEALYEEQGRTEPCPMSFIHVAVPVTTNILIGTLGSTPQFHQNLWIFSSTNGWPLWTWTS